MEFETTMTTDGQKELVETKIGTQLPKSVKYMAGLISGIRGDNVHTKLSSQEDM